MKVPSFNEANLEQVCDVLGDTSSGLTGSEIGRYLRDCEIADPNPGITKRIRLFNASTHAPTMCVPSYNGS